jgi:tetratricopeptide (TPR) repeat protein
VSEQHGKSEGQGLEAAKGDPRPELRKLVELCTQYPEIGPPVAELAYKVGCPDIAEQVVALGTGGDRPGVEFFFVKAQAARRSSQHQEVLRLTTEALETFSAAPDEAVGADEPSRLLHLVRLGFATLMFDLKDVRSAPAFSDGLAERLLKLEGRLGQDPFYRSLLAQALWFGDVEKSEAEWERAAEIDSSELTWNARGTWYKEAERDAEKAEATYRRGLEAVPQSALLLHNVAQLLVDRAEARKSDAGAAHKLLSEAEELLRAALREDAPKVRRHIHATRDRLYGLRRSLPRQQKGPPGNQRGKRGGQDRGKGGRPPQAAKGGEQQGQRPPPKGRGGKGGGRREHRQPDFQTDGRIRLGDVLLSKLKDKNNS